MAALEVIALDEATPQLRAPGASDTYTMPRATLIAGGTISGAGTTPPALDITQTWNTTGVPVGGIRLRVTDTASTGNPLLFDIGTSTGTAFNITKFGATAVGSVLTCASQVRFSSAIAATGDVILGREAANILYMRNSTNAQTFLIHGTYTDASNYRRAKLTMTTGGVASLSAEGLGTGATGNVLHISSLPTANPGPGILWNNAGTPAIGT
jgi:hypothetical protein